MEKASLKTISTNKKARHNYFIEETIEAGIELFGTEVKSIREGKVNISNSYATSSGGEIFIKDMNISPYEKGNIFNKDPLRERKLLLHKREIRRLIGVLSTTGYALVPLSLYFKGSLVKVALGVCKGKKLYDKRDDIHERDSKRKMDRAFKEHLNRS